MIATALSAGAIQYQDSPARKSSETPSATMIRVVPRLGSNATKAAGTAIMPRAMAKDSGLEISSTLLPCRKRDSASTREIFISSEGCNSNPPTPIQRCAPSGKCPTTSTAIRSKQRQGIGGIGQAHPDADVDGRCHLQDEKSQDEFGDLRHGPGMKLAACHRIEHRETGTSAQREVSSTRPQFTSSSFSATLKVRLAAA